MHERQVAAAKDQDAAMQAYIRDASGGTSDADQLAKLADLHSATLYASTKDHLNEFATLRALGASAGYIHRVILMQAVLSAVIGYLLGMCLSLLVIEGSKATTLLILMTPNLALMLFVLTVGMCILAAICAIFKVTRIDPAVVFSR
jgi:putative ABC transport system permease protein